MRGKKGEKLLSTLTLGVVLFTSLACSWLTNLSSAPPEPDLSGLPSDTQSSSEPTQMLIQDSSVLPKIPVIWDDDGSPDGIIALLYLLKHPAIRLEGIAVSCGEAHPQVFAENLTRMLARIGRQGIPVAAGRDTPLEGNNAFPESWRAATDIFWEAELPATESQTSSKSASQLIIEIVKNSPEPVIIFLTGNHTNLAEALRLDPSIADNIQLIEVMGGAFEVDGNIASDYPEIPNWVAEWNIWVDPMAADEVFQSGIPIQLMPLDATNYVVWTEDDAVDWESSRSPEGILAAEILRWMLRSWFPTGVYAWDVVAAVDMTNPEHCFHTDQHVWVDTAPGDKQGRTLIDGNKSPNISVCETPNEGEVKRLLRDIFDLP
ncbi:MAG: nucleoside hydrolase [Anaerolineales bacterium]